MKDPFHELLEDSLEVPDLELGDSLRRSLLAAAAAAEGPANVVPFVRPDDAERQAFDWLLGESEADRALMDRVIGEPEFFEEVVSQQQFLRHLRGVMRAIPAVAQARGSEEKCGAVAPRCKWRAIAAVAGSIAAALALMAGFGNGFSGSKGGTASMVSAAPVANGSSGASLSSTRVSTNRHASERPFESPVYEVSKAERATVAAALSDQRSAVEDGMAEILETREAALIAAREVYGNGRDQFGIEAVSDPMDVREKSLVASSERGETSAAFRSQSNWDPAFMSTDNGWSRWYIAGNSNMANVPEPGPCVPVVIFTILLMLRRKRRSGSVA